MRAHTPGQPSLLTRVRERLADERGMSLILALGFLVIFTISTTAIVNELVLNESGAKRDQAMLTALGAAEAEMNFAQQWVEANDALSDKAEGTVFPTSTDAPNAALASGDTTPDTTKYFTGNAVAGATHYGWWAHKYSHADCLTINEGVTTGYNCWLVDGRATIGQSTREVQVLLTTNVTDPGTQTTITTPTVVATSNTQTGTTTSTVPVLVPTTANDYGSWGYGTFSSGASGGCYTMSGNGSIQEPVYHPGNLCMGGNAQIIQNTSNNVTVYIKGSLTITGNNPHIGTSASKVTTATIGSCTAGGSAVICSNSASSKVYALTYASTGAAINKPTVSAASLYTSADPGPNHPCTVAAGSTASNTWPTFDGNTTRDSSVGSTSSPWTGTSYTCKTATGGNISWNATTHVFTITGTVFVDGSLSPPNYTVVYSGRGNIYYNGTMAMAGNSAICPTSTCSTTAGAWDMGVNLLLIGVLNNGVVPNPCAYTIDMSGNAIFQGAAWANGCVKETGNGGLEGPISADGYQISGNGTFYQPLGANTLPPGSPVNGITTSVTTNTTSTLTYSTIGGTTYSTNLVTTTTYEPWGQFSTSWRQLK